MKLTEAFGKVYIINCQHRPDRKEQLTRHLNELGLVDWSGVEWVRAIVGDFTGHPACWGAGRGAWGCLRSHCRIMEDAMHDRANDTSKYPSILILEDDVVFCKDAAARLEDIFLELPKDWGQLYLGGQHRGKNAPFSKHMVVGGSVNRTHAYAVHRNWYPRVYQHINHWWDYINTTKHIDHQLELAHQRKDWLVLCASPWIAGQAAGSSNVSGRKDTERWWQ